MTTTAVREKPILFSGPMVLALLAGRKTQTRRVVKLDKELINRHGDLEKATVDRGGTIFGPGPYLKIPCATDIDGSDDGGTVQRLHCPYGYPEYGDRLWVRETFDWFAGSIVKLTDGNTGKPKRFDQVLYRAEGHAAISGRWTPSIYMPRWASRITLEITEVRVERLQSISAKDILAEGVVERSHYDQNGLGKCPVSAIDGCCYVDLKSLWAFSWDKINGKRAGCAWKDNPLCWAISFKVVKP